MATLTPPSATTKVPSLPGPPAPQANRSSWYLRGLFVLLFIGLGGAGVTVMALVGYTALNLNSARPDGPGPVEPIVRQNPVDPVAQADPELADENLDLWDKHGPIDILLLGVDANGCGALVEEGPSRTDTIILVRVDPASKKVAMLSIPRDLYVYIPANGYGNVVGAKKITTAHVYGTVFDEDGREVPHSGPELVKQTIRDNLGVPVHRYIRVDFAGFEQIVEAVGGIEVDVAPSLEDPSIGLYDDGYPDGHCGTMTINFPPGRQKLDGVQALQYARSRKSTSDFDRSRRQMQVLLAIRERGTRLGVILDLPRLIPALRETIDTDLTPDEILSLANTARGVKSENVLRMQMDENVVYNDMLVIDGVAQYVLRLQQEPYDALREAFLNPASVLNAPPAADLDSLGATESGEGVAAP